jgi:hypothetical protein
MFLASPIEPIEASDRFLGASHRLVGGLMLTMSKSLKGEEARARAPRSLVHRSRHSQLALGVEIHNIVSICGLANPLLLPTTRHIQPTSPSAETTQKTLIVHGSELLDVVLSAVPCERGAPETLPCNAYTIKYLSLHLAQQPAASSQ